MTENNNVLEFPELDGVEEEAAVWVARLDARDLSHAEQAELRAWLKRSPVHQEAFSRMGAIWGGADVLDEYNLIDPVGVGGQNPQRTPRRLILISAIAASLALICGIVVTQLGLWPTSSQTATFRTAVSEQETVDLIDGSRMILNTDSEVAVDISRKHRTISLVRGEVHFEVAKDPDRRFNVYAGQGLVQAVGTAFSVHLRDTDVEVTVSEGVVQVFSREADMSASNGANNNQAKGEAEYKSLAALAVNESAVFDDKIERFGKMESAEIERKLMWRDGLVEFSGEPLSEVVKEMSRYTDIEIDIADPSLATIPIGGAFEAGNIQSMFDALETVFGIEVESESPTRVRLVRRS